MRAWEVRATVALGVEEVALTFEFEGAEVVDQVTGAPFVPPVGRSQSREGG